MKLGLKAWVTGIIFEPNPGTFGIDVGKGDPGKSQVFF